MTNTELVVTEEENDASRREAQLVAATIHGGVSVYKRICWQCKKPFVTNSSYYGLCSDWCISDYLYDRGLNWNPEETPEERWPEEEPDAIITSDTLLVLQTWARKILKLTS